MSMPKITCPICGESDQIQKVSAVINAQTSFVSGTERRWTSEEGWQNVPFHGVETSELARQLQPLREPRKEVIVWFGLIPANLFSWWATVMLILSTLCYGTMSIGMLGIGIFSLLRSEPQFLFGFPMSIALGGILLWFWVRIPRKKQKGEQKYREEIDIYNKAMERWERLYYCYRDDRVFDEKNQSSFRPDLTHNYLTSD